MDQDINARGVLIDVPALDAMLAILDQTERKYTAELAVLTGGAVETIDQTEKIVDWCNDCGLDLPNLQAAAVTEALALFEGE